MLLSNDNFKKTIIAFWAVWWLIALWTDLVGAFAHLGWLQASWAPDVNYPNLANSLQMYHASERVINLLFLGIIAWSFVSTAAFCWASASLLQKRSVWMLRAQIAFIISLSYWLAFFLADQFVMKFDLEENHMVQGGFQFLTYLALYILPEK